MYISMNWIKDFVDLEGIDSKELINQFTLSTAEVEGIIEYGKNTKDVVVGKILSVEDVENSSKLHQVVVDIESDKITCICGAPNVKEGIKVAFAKEGSLVNGVIIHKTMIAGHESCGMCLSEKELGISEDHTGVMILEEDTPLGIDIKKVIPLEDVVFEVDNKSLTNRPDLWGHYGIAREIAAITGRKLKPLEVEELSLYNHLKKLPITIENKEDCLRYSAITIDQVTKKKSSYSMKIRLTYCGLRPISLLVDMTNYMMLELGQPMHAFDKDFIHSISVKTVKEETTFTTLDQTTRKLEPGTLMIYNEQMPVAIAGVMGGENTQITEGTTSLFLESANFNAVLVRKTASSLALRTDASARYEKTLDPELTKIAIARFIHILKKEDNQVEVSSSFSDVYVNHYPKIEIEITRAYINQKIGIDFTLEKIIQILESLEFQVEQKDVETILVKVPSFRATKDVSGKADLVEEISRIYGYDNIIPQTNFWKVSPVREENIRKLEYGTKELLAQKYGLSEIHTYVWYDTKLNKELGIEVEDNLKIVNGLNRLDSTLRATMGPSMLYGIEKNKKKEEEFGIFEIGRTFSYPMKGENCIENKVLGIAKISNKQTEEELLLEAKSMVESIAKIYKNRSFTYFPKEEKEKFLHPAHSYTIEYQGKKLGTIASLHPKVKDHINPKANVVLVELKMDELANLQKEPILYQEISRYQTVDFDFSIVVDQSMAYADIEAVIQESDLVYLQTFKLMDVYENNEKLKDKKNITIRFTIGSYEKTLTKEEIDQEREKLITNLNKHQMSICS